MELCGLYFCYFIFLFFYDPPSSRIASCVRSAGMVTRHLHLTWPCCVALGQELIWVVSQDWFDKLCQLGFLIPNYLCALDTTLRILITWYTLYVMNYIILPTWFAEIFRTASFNYIYSRLSRLCTDITIFNQLYSFKTIIIYF